MPLRRAPPPMRIGALPSSVSTRAPMARSGAAMRSMGRLRSEASPVSSTSKDCPASSPVMSRMPVPELPRSSGRAGGWRPRGPTPSTCSVPSPSARIGTPSASSACHVAVQSSPLRNPRTTVGPSAIAPSIRERWEMDLSPGTAMTPPMRSTGRATKCRAPPPPGLLLGEPAFTARPSDRPRGPGTGSPGARLPPAPAA